MLYKLIVLFIIVFIFSCKPKQSVALCGGVEENLTYLDSIKKGRGREYYDKLLHNIYPNIHLEGMFYDLKTKKKKSDDDYCSIVLTKENSRDSVVINGSPGFGQEFKFGRFNVRYKSINRFFIDKIKIDTVLLFDSLSYYKLDIFSDDSLNKIQFKLNKIYQF